MTISRIVFGLILFIIGFVLSVYCQSTNSFSHVNNPNVIIKKSELKTNMSETSTRENNFQIQLNSTEQSVEIVLPDFEPVDKVKKFIIQQEK